jgi:hypothetical protein
VRPSFISFTIAFIVAAMQWVGPRDLFTLIRDTAVGVPAGALRGRVRDRRGVGGASLAVYASAPVLYFITITLLRRLAPRGSAERQFT